MAVYWSESIASFFRHRFHRTLDDENAKHCVLRHNFWRRQIWQHLAGAVPPERQRSCHCARGPGGCRSAVSHGSLDGLDLLAHFLSMTIPTSINKSSLATGGLEVFIRTDMQGTIGILVLFASQAEMDFSRCFTTYARAGATLSRDQLQGYFAQVEGVVDEDLCKWFRLLYTN